MDIIKEICLHVTGISTTINALDNETLRQKCRLGEWGQGGRRKNKFPKM